MKWSISSLGYSLTQMTGVVQLYGGGMHMFPSDLLLWFLTLVRNAFPKTAVQKNEESDDDMTAIHAQHVKI